MASYLFESCLPKSEAQDNFTNGSLLMINQTMYNTSFLNASGYNVEGIPDPAYYTVRKVVKILHSIICLFGLLGNLLTMLILTRKRLKMSCDGTEQTVHTGLIALAVSDFLFCLTLLPYSLLNNNAFTFSSISFQLIYETYSNAFINTFLLTSTWLTVTIATGRYLAICHPFKARHMIGMTGTRVTIFCVFIICAVFNIPRLFEHQIDNFDCHDGRTSYIRVSGYMERNERTHTIYMWIYFIIGITLPLCTLAYCNFCLARVLHESVKIRRRSRVPAAHVDANYRITSILVTIVVMYITLVSPSEIFLFIQQRLYKGHQNTLALVLTVEVTNLLQMINFSCNFILYFVLNINFRRAMRDMFCLDSQRHHRPGSEAVMKLHPSKMSDSKSRVAEIGFT